MQSITSSGALDLRGLVDQVRAWGRELGFQAVAVAGIDLADCEPQLAAWLAQGCHGDMDYMARHGSVRTRPAELVPGTVRVICARMNYLPAGARSPEHVLADASLAYVARYALGRDYHKVVRARLQQLARRIEASIGSFGYRVFTDSAPVMEVALGVKSGMGWRGKHTLLLARDAGSYFFLGEIYTDLPLPVDEPQQEHCGNCTRCIDVCPTGAILAPYQLDARRCISYLTIEHKGAIPEELRPAIGNRIYGCDDCQLVCPWNRFARPATLADFRVRHGLDAATLVALFGWTRAQFDACLSGSPIRRIGYSRWLRNVAVGLGNAPSSPAVMSALCSRLDDESALVREHVSWAIARHAQRSEGS